MLCRGLWSVFKGVIKGIFEIFLLLILLLIIPSSDSIGHDNDSGVKHYGKADDDGDDDDDDFIWKLRVISYACKTCYVSKPTQNESVSLFVFLYQICWSHEESVIPV